MTHSPATDAQVEQWRKALADGWLFDDYALEDVIAPLLARVDAEILNRQLVEHGKDLNELALSGALNEAREHRRRLFEALETALKKGASWESRQEAADLLDELRPHVAKEQG